MLAVRVGSEVLDIKEYKERRVVTLTDVDRVHQRPEGTASRNFRRNKERFIVDDDYFEISQPDEIRRLGFFRTQGGTPEKLFLITESGYLMLVKSLNDDLAWQVQRILVNEYFRGKGTGEQDEFNRQMLNTLAQLKGSIDMMNEKLSTFQVNLPASLEAEMDMIRFSSIQSDSTEDRRKHKRAIYTVDKLKCKDKLIEMFLSNRYTYKELEDFVKSQGEQCSRSSINRYMLNKFMVGKVLQSGEVEVIEKEGRRIRFTGRDSVKSGKLN